MAREDYCERHDIDLTNLPTGYTQCPLCEEERRIEAERAHMMTRDRMVEPW